MFSKRKNTHCIECNNAHYSATQTKTDKKPKTKNDEVRFAKNSMTKSNV